MIDLPHMCHFFNRENSMITIIFYSPREFIQQVSNFYRINGAKTSTARGKWLDFRLRTAHFIVARSCHAIVTEL